MGLAVSLELPLLIIDIQRGGPSTGLPTKTEQADLLMAMYGRHGESPMPIVAARSPSHCFDAAIEAARIALKYRTPVLLLSDGYIANGSEPWRLPDVDDPARHLRRVRHRAQPHRCRRQPRVLALPPRPRHPGPAVGHARHPGPDAPHRRHREGGRHGQHQLRPGQPRAHGRACGRPRWPASPPTSRRSRSPATSTTPRCWSSAGARRGAPSTGAIGRLRNRGRKVAHAHLTHLNPFPADLGEVLARYPQVVVPEMNLGQLSRLLRAEFLVDARSVTKVQGVPFTAGELEQSSTTSPIPESQTSKERPRPRDHRAIVAVPPTTTRKDWSSDQEVRWCPGCGDYSILTAVQMLMPELGVQPENTVFVSGIGCAARFPYYMNTYGMHSIHGRAPAIATGLAMARPDLDVWVVGGDGDMLSIGGNHLIHALRRNVNLTILMFNNQIYGLTKGQYSPTSEVGKVTKSHAVRLARPPVQPGVVALGAEATFVARTHDMDRAHMMEMIRRAHDHQGAAFVEIFQNCNVFNDGAFEAITGKERRDDMLIPLVPRRADPLRGRPREVRRGRSRRPGAGHRPSPTWARTASSSTTRPAPIPGWRSLSRGCRRGPIEPTPIGVFRAVERPEYGEETQVQIDTAMAQKGPGDLAALLRSGATWDVSG